MDKDMPAGWALKRACDLTGPRESWCNSFARYIEAHEKPPVDPDLVTAREICAAVADELTRVSAAHMYRSADLDDEPEVQFALSKLKEARGK